METKTQRSKRLQAESAARYRAWQEEERKTEALKRAGAPEAEIKAQDAKAEEAWRTM